MEMWTKVWAQVRVLIAVFRLASPAELKVNNLKIRGATAAEVNKMMREFFRQIGK